MRSRRAFRPVVEDMPRLALLSGGVIGIVPPGSVFVPTDPLLPVRIPSTPPPSYFIDPNTPYRITIPMRYDEPIVGPDDPAPTTDPGSNPSELVCVAPGPLAPPPPVVVVPPPPAPSAPLAPPPPVVMVPPPVVPAGSAC